MISREQSRLVIKLISSSERSLKSLAEMTDLDTFSFYQGADLRGLDLTRQDLTGLNFDKADLRFSMLDNVQYDEGAFNGSILNEDQNWLKDEYEFYAEDVLKHPAQELLIFFRFRPGNIDRAVAALEQNYASFSYRSGTSENALRKARQGKVVAFETATRIIQTAMQLAVENGIENSSDIRSLIWQPVVEFVSGGNNGKFVHIGRDRLKYLFEIREEIVSIRRRIYPSGAHAQSRDTPEILDTLLGFYRKERQRLDGQRSG